MQKFLFTLSFLSLSISSLHAGPLAALFGLKGPQTAMLLRQARALYHPLVIETVPRISAFGDVYLLPILKTDTPFVVTLKNNLEFPENFEKCLCDREFSSKNTHAINAMLDYCYEYIHQKEVLKSLIFGSRQSVKRSLLMPDFYYQVVNAVLAHDHGFFDAVNAGHAKDCGR